jgi:hypothetical protein
MVASHRPIGLFARPIFYGAFLVALVGLAISSYWGWRNLAWIPAPGESRGIGHGFPYKIRLDSLERPPGEDSEICDFASQLTWLEGDVELASAVTSVGQPAGLGGIAVRQVGLLPVATVRGQDDAGRPLSFQVEEGIGTTTEIMIELPSSEEQYPVRVAGHNLYLVLTLSQVNLQDNTTLRAALLPSEQLEVRLGDADYQALAGPREPGTLTLDNLEIRASLDFRPILRVDYRPGMIPVVGGLAIALLALLMGWLASPHLVWIAVEAETETSATVRLLGQPSSRGSQYVPKLANQLQEGLCHNA